MQPVVTLKEDNCIDAKVGALLEGKLKRLVTRHGMHHALLAITSGDGAQRWSAAVGPAEVVTDPPHPDSPFFAASITKRVIVTLLLQAYERGEVDLNAPATAYLAPTVTAGLHILRGVDYTSAITLRHLASHTSGLPDYLEKRRHDPGLYRKFVTGQDVAWTFDDIVQITREQRPWFTPQDLHAPRQQARYSDTGFQLLIRVLETATRRPYADLLAERILQPLGLTGTWLPLHPQAAATPLPICTGRRKLTLPLVIKSSNDVVSTTKDLIRFQTALLDGELVRDRGILGSLTERTNRLRNIPMLRYGLGTMVFKVGRFMSAGRRPVSLIGHSGSTGTWLFYCPDLDVHFAGSVDQVKGQVVPFRFLSECLMIWRQQALQSPSSPRQRRQSSGNGHL